MLNNIINDRDIYLSLLGEDNTSVVQHKIDYNPSILNKEGDIYTKPWPRYNIPK